MTTTTTTNGHRKLSAAEARQLARQLVADAAETGQPVTGDELGRATGRTDRWGRAQLAEISAEETPEMTAAAEISAEVPPEETRPPQSAAPAELLAQISGRISAEVPAEKTTAAEISAEAAAEDSGSRGRVWATGGFLLGIGGSIAANVADANATAGGDRWGPRLWGAFVPLCLLVSVEIMARVRWPVGANGWQRFGWWLARFGGVGLVAGVTAVVSYRHIAALLISYHEDTVNAAIGPLAVDGLMVISGAALLVLHGRGRQA